MEEESGSGLTRATSSGGGDGLGVEEEGGVTRATFSDEDLVVEMDDEDSESEEEEDAVHVKSG